MLGFGEVFLGESEGLDELQVPGVELLELLILLSDD